MRDELVVRFARLFEGRTDAYGAEEGMAERANGVDYIDRVNEHLNGDRPMGVYPLMYVEPDGWVVNWGCVDFDEGDAPSWIHACNLQTVLEQLGVKGWIERSRSKGYHVWVFSSDLVPAHVMRRALLGATQIARAPVKEINPKTEGFWLPRVSQDSALQPDVSRLGNYVRLPYPKGYSNRRVMCRQPSSVTTVGLHEFVDEAHASRTTRLHLSSLAPLYKEPERPKPRVQPRQTSVDGPVTSKISGLSFVVFRDGPLDGMDRSSALWRLANLLYTDGLTQDEAIELMLDADERWGKYHARNDQKELYKMVDRIWA
jgi:hypothetical protein